MSEEEQIDNLLKIIVLGDSGVGKTNIIQRYTNNKFFQEISPTIGVDFSTMSIQIKNKLIKIQFWDTAGQEKYQAISQAYYKNAHGVFIVYDITSQQSFDKALNWLKEIKIHSEQDVKIMLLGNKSDLDSLRQVDKKSAEAFAENQNMQFREVSAKTNENNCVNQAIEKLINDIFDKIELDYDSMSENRLLSLSNHNQIKTNRKNEEDGCC